MKKLKLVSIVPFLIGGGIFFPACTDAGNPIEERNSPCAEPISCAPSNVSDVSPGKIVFSSITTYGVHDSVYNNYYDQIQLFTINPDGTGLQQMTHFDLAVSQLTLSPDGSKIAFTSWGPQGPGINTLYIYIYALSDSSTRRLSDFPIGEPQSLAWSPDGKKIAYDFCFNCEAAGMNTEIFVIDLETKTIERITQSLAADTGPSWSPGGNEIVFVSNRDDPVTRKGELYIIDVQTKALTRLTCTLESEGLPWWSPDGCRIAYGFEGYLHVLDLSTMDTRRVIPLGAQMAGPVGGYTAWSPDAKALVRLDTDTLFTVHLDGKGKTTLAMFPSATALGRPSTLQWVPMR